MFGALKQKNVKLLQFSVGLTSLPADTIPENGIENEIFVLEGFKKPKQSEEVSGSWGLCNTLSQGRALIVMRNNYSVKS